MIRSAHKTSYQKQRASSAILFALAIVVIVVSCPLKRMLNSVTPSASPRIAYVSVSQGTSVATPSQVSYCALKAKVTLLGAELKAQQTPLPLPLIASIRLSGFDIPYFLSGTPQTYHTTETVLSSNLPLYLEHRRLLI
jgi:flagellar biogenesis protein FliO